MSAATPIRTSERISQIDIMRGFALFGVLWINLVTQSHELAPAGAFDNLPTAWLDGIIAPIAYVLVTGKAMALFSLLFGFGFAMMVDRLEHQGLDAGRIFLRRITILLIIGLTHIFLVWLGDILHVYALMGFVLFLTRRWSDRALLICGLALALLSTPVVEFVLHQLYDYPFPWFALYEEGPVRRFDIMLGNNYSAYVAELWRATWTEMWGTPDYIPYISITLGRFMLGAWIFRQGWLQHAATYLGEFRRWSMVLVGAGVAFALLGRALYGFDEDLGYWFEAVPQLVLGLGYGATVVVLCRGDGLPVIIKAIGDVGRMALTNYLVQSLVYVFVLFGFGFGLLRYLGATLCLTIALSTFAAQMVFSRWWLSRFRFGPVEWLWRSLTYGKRQRLRLETV